MEYSIKCILFDWGNTLMKEFPEFKGPMCAWPSVEVIPGARETLMEAGKGRIIALGTNAFDSNETEIRKALKRVSLDVLIDKIYCLHRTGISKPLRGFFEYILGDLSLAVNEIVIVGDDFEKDILGANRCGMFGFWLNQRSNTRRVGRLHDTIFALKDLTAALARREDSIREEASR